MLIIIMLNFKSTAALYFGRFYWSDDWYFTRDSDQEG